MPKGKWLRVGSPLWDSPLSDDPTSQYEDEHGVIWRFRTRKRADGWWEIEARPWKPGDAYGIKVDRWPMSMLSADGINRDDGTEAAREAAAEAVDDVVDAKKKGSNWGTLLLILLGLYVIGSDKRRYVGARDEQWF